MCGGMSDSVTLDLMKPKRTPKVLFSCIDDEDAAFAKDLP